MQTAEYVGLKIAELRRKGGCTQAELGAFLNISPQAISKWERGESCPDFDMLCKIAEFFVVPISYFQQNGERNATKENATPTAAVPKEERRLIGVCQKCGKVVYAGEEGFSAYGVICRVCQKWGEVEAAERRDIEEGSRKAIKAVIYEQYGKPARNKGLIWGAILSLVWTVPTLFSTIFQLDDSFTREDILLILLTGLMLFTFISQLWWRGWVRKCVRMGVDAFLMCLDDEMMFFPFSLILFPLGIIGFVIGSIIGIIGGLFTSPFSFLPAMKRMSDVPSSDDK